MKVIYWRVVGVLLGLSLVGSVILGTVGNRPYDEKSYYLILSILIAFFFFKACNYEKEACNKVEKK